MSKPTCFIIMPISVPEERLADYGNDPDHFRHVLDHLHVPAVEAADFEAIRPIAEGADLIHAEIIKNLESADLVLCDMSTRNPNVFFELGIRTALNKPVCLVRDSLTMKVPFDTGILNHDVYDPNLLKWVLDRELPRLTKHIIESAKRSRAANPMWQYLGMTSRADLAAARPNSVEEKLGLLTDRIEELARSIGQDQAPAYENAFASMTNILDPTITNAVQMALMLTGLGNTRWKISRPKGENVVEVSLNGPIPPEQLQLFSEILKNNLAPIRVNVGVVVANL